MSRKRTPIAVTAGRTVVSACWTTGCWILWVILLVIAGFLATVIYRHEVPVPGFILHRLEERFELAGLTPRFGATRVDPTGTLVIEDLRVQSPMFAEPVASARAVVLNLNLWAVLVGDFDVDSVQVIGLELNCPAMLSPSGTSMPVVRNLHATFVRENHRWRVPSADFRIGQIYATVSGDWDPKGSAGAALPADPKEWVRRYYDVSRTIANRLDQLAGLGETHLHASFTIRRNEPLHITLEGDAEHLKARGLTLSNVHLRIDHNDARRPAPPLQIDVTAPDILVEDRVNIVRPWVRETGELEINPFKFKPGPLEFSADSVAWQDAKIGSLIFRTSLAGLPVIEGELTASHGASVVDALGSVDPRDGSVSASVALWLDAATIEEGLSLATKRVKSVTLKRLHFGGPLQIEGELRLGNQWKFQGARGWMRTVNADIAGVSADTAAGWFDATPRNLFSKDLVLEGRDLHGRGTYDMDFLTRDYRFLIQGRTYPDVIAPWFTDWWDRFWERFTFEHKDPLAVDLSIEGRWGSRHYSKVVGSVETGPMTLYQLPFDHVLTRIFVRDEFYDVLSLDANVGDRFLTGSFTHDDRPEGDVRRRIRFNARTNLEVPKYTRLAGPELPEILTPYVFEQPPDITTSGNVTFRDSGISEDVRAQVAAPAIFRFYDFPVKNASFDVAVKDGTVDVRDIRAEFGSGGLTAEVHSEDPPPGRTVQFHAKLEAARLDEATAQFTEFRRTAATDKKKSFESVLSGKGTLNLEVDAAGPVANVWGFSGKGTATISNAELGHIRVLGPLSKLFEGTILSFTSFRLTNADAVFAINGDHLEFSKLELTGPSAQLRSFGRFTMPTSELAFNTTIFPFRESSMPVMNVLGFVLEPFSRALELRLSGTVEKPKWAFAAGSSIPKYEPVKPPTILQPGTPPGDAPGKDEAPATGEATHEPVPPASLKAPSSP